jgi:hypothetical protein
VRPQVDHRRRGLEPEPVDEHRELGQGVGLPRGEELPGALERGVQAPVALDT